MVVNGLFLIFFDFFFFWGSKSTNNKEPISERYAACMKELYNKVLPPT